MSQVLATTDGDPGIEVPALTEAAARRLTEQIKTRVTAVNEKLLEAFEGRAHVALGYARWEDYMRTEFGIGRQQSYKVIDQAQVVHRLSAAAGVSHARDIGPVSIRMAAALKGDLDAATVEITQAVTDGVPIQEAIRTAVERRRSGRVIPVGSMEASTNGHRPPPPTPAEVAAVFVAELRPRLRHSVEHIRACLRSAPTPARETDDPDAVRVELHTWVSALSGILHEASLADLYALRADLYRLGKMFDPIGGRDLMAELAGVSRAAVDYTVTNTPTLLSNKEPTMRA